MKSYVHLMVDLMENRLEDLLDVVPELAALKGVPQPPDVHTKDVWGHTKDVLAAVSYRSPITVWAAALHDIGKPSTLIPEEKRVPGAIWFPKHAEIGAKMADAILHRIGARPELIHTVLGIIDRHVLAYAPTWSDTAVRRLVREVGDFTSFMTVVTADTEVCTTEHRTKQAPMIQALLERVKNTPMKPPPKTQKITARGLLEKRLAWTREKPAELVWPGGPSRDEYAAGFVRKAGSYVEEVTDMSSLRTFFDKVGELIPVNPGTLPAGCNDPECTYFEAAVPPGYSAIESATLTSKLPAEALAEVHLVEGPHGLEFQLDRPGRRTNVVKFVADASGLRTWYPGECLPPNPTVVTVKFTCHKEEQ